MTAIAYEDLPRLAGQVLGHTDWVTIDQARVDTFADAVADHQWIHVDPERAATGPYGGTIAHGYLTLSLVAPLWDQLVPGIRSGEWDIDRVRFLSPVRVGSRVRLTSSIASVTRVPGGLELAVDASMEIEGGDRPALVLRSRTRVHG
ncbi:MaoC family dehydratase [Agromyces sp. NPDC049794]|uniref:MaoC family dehydratase n=1 Tax=unclassified Agromyces TaxID=2639701 RepID=UPI003407A41D